MLTTPAKTESRSPTAQPVKGKAKAPLAPEAAPSPGAALLTHDRDESSNSAAAAPDPVIQQAKRDLDAGKIDTDLRATPGLDATRRAELVPDAGGKPAGKGK